MVPSNSNTENNVVNKTLTAIAVIFALVLSAGSAQADGELYKSLSEIKGRVRLSITQKILSAPDVQRLAREFKTTIEVIRDDNPSRTIEMCRGEKGNYPDRINPAGRTVQGRSIDVWMSCPESRRELIITQGKIFVFRGKKKSAAGVTVLPETRATVSNALAQLLEEEDAQNAKDYQTVVVKLDQMSDEVGKLATSQEESAKAQQSTVDRLAKTYRNEHQTVKALALATSLLLLLLGALLVLLIYYAFAKKYAQEALFGEKRHNAQLQENLTEKDGRLTVLSGHLDEIKGKYATSMMTLEEQNKAQRKEIESMQRGEVQMKAILKSTADKLGISSLTDKADAADYATLIAYHVSRKSSAPPAPTAEEGQTELALGEAQAGSSEAPEAKGPEGDSVEPPRPSDGDEASQDSIH